MMTQGNVERIEKARLCIEDLENMPGVAVEKVVGKRG